MPTDSPSLAAPVIVIAPDSYKGSLSARQVADAIGRGILQAIPQAILHICPIADGGEGTLDAMLHAGGKTGMLSVRDAGGAMREAPVALLPNGAAVIESAEIVGITDTRAMARPVAERSTEGIGDAIRLLLDRGVRSFLIALGGSSTNDGGAGMLCALGLRLYDATGAILPPGPAALQQLARIDASGLDPRLAQASIVGMSDVDNPLCGEHGASAVFGPQKGVQPDQVAQLDRALAHFADLFESAVGRRAATIAGAGAAGGLGYGLLMLGGQLQSGAETVCTHIGLDAHLAGADWLITGEGRSDAQTLHGKAPFIAARRARGFGVDSSLLSGAVDQQALAELGRHFKGCFSIVPGPMTLAQAIADADRLLQASASQIAAIWQAGRMR
ncbi:glycerate kinase [Oxalobacteraceae bacterium CAVE-383]|nr:glycerate kinase [Oxalobacteraceae bacterium CAVE-383]